jgi:hypothetical protein
MATVPVRLACKLFWKQPEQLVKTTSSFSPRNLAAILKPGAVAPGWQELFLSVVIVVSFSTKLILIYIPVQARAADDIILVGLAFHRQPQEAIERRPCPASRRIVRSMFPPEPARESRSCGRRSSRASPAR